MPQLPLTATTTYSPLPLGARGAIYTGCLCVVPGVWATLYVRPSTPNFPPLTGRDPGQNPGQGLHGYIQYIYVRSTVEVTPQIVSTNHGSGFPPEVSLKVPDFAISLYRRMWRKDGACGGKMEHVEERGGCGGKRRMWRKEEDVEKRGI